jgi:hypothetical protein
VCISVGIQFGRSLIYLIKSLLIPTEHCLPLLWLFGTIIETGMGAIWLGVTGDFSSLNRSHLLDLNRRES